MAENKNNQQKTTEIGQREPLHTPVVFPDVTRGYTDPASHVEPTVFLLRVMC